MILDPRTASAATGIPVRTIQRWVVAGRLRDYGDGTRLQVDVDDVAQLAQIRSAFGTGFRLPIWHEGNEARRA